MRLLAQSNDLNYRVFSFAVCAALLCIAGLTAARWSRRRLDGAPLDVPRVEFEAPC